LALKWAAKEMDRRYDILEAEKVRDIESYHKNVLAPALKKAEQEKDSGKSKDKNNAPDKSTIDPENTEKAATMPETMPYIVVVIDELADLMQTYPRELEAAIVRLAQMSRAVGIHLILSTQRPSVNVITGLIKANIPSRVALQVMSQIDSRTILDTVGAEKLLGAGDMLYLSGDMSKPQRVQSAYISENELKSVVEYLISNYANELPEQINFDPQNKNPDDDNSIFSSGFDDAGGDEDDLYEEAKEIVLSAGKASTSYIQRKLRVGYARAARLIDMLEERGIVTAGEGSKPREVIGGGSSQNIPDDSDSTPE
jgi:S-DNA-T family DNA segregation ATPase FtsK/SpoIIIE